MSEADEVRQQEGYIDVALVTAERPTQALALRQESGAVGRAMTIDELHANLEFVRQVMRREMKEGQDYGKIPGCGDKPALLQPGAQKLMMTFNLSEYVKKEEVRDFPGYHREYAFTLCVRAPNGKEWDGVGTCSTLEAKYRYRKAERMCPKCGHNTITADNPKFLKPGQVAGWFCWKKKGGCGATFAKADPAIASQAAGRTENPDPAETWNTVRKMAFKRALVAAAINATNTSELWTQDIEDRDPRGDESASEAPSASQATPGRAESAPKPSSPPPASKPASASAQRAPTTAFVPTVESRAKMIEQLKAGPGQPHRDIVTEYFTKLDNPSQLMPGEALEDLPLRFVPASQDQMHALSEMITRFGNGDRAQAAFHPHAMSVDFGKPGGVKTPAEVAPKVVAEAKAKAQDPEWWRNVIVPIPPKGMPRAEYLKSPQTIGQLYDLRHGNDEEARAARQRLWGFVNHFEAKAWVGRDGKERPASDTDKKFREALDAFGLWFEKNHPDEKL